MSIINELILPAQSAISPPQSCRQAGFQKRCFQENSLKLAWADDGSSGGLGELPRLRSGFRLRAQTPAYGSTSTSAYPASRDSRGAQDDKSEMISSKETIFATVESKLTTTNRVPNNLAAFM
jgi:hypothetical protein